MYQTFHILKAVNYSTILAKKLLQGKARFGKVLNTALVTKISCDYLKVH